jgi:hypothetical protein
VEKVKLLSGSANYDKYCKECNKWERKPILSPAMPTMTGTGKTARDGEESQNLFSNSNYDR